MSPGRTMLMMKGSVVVTFGIDPERASAGQRARLVENGMSLRILYGTSTEVGPVLPVPSGWLTENGGVAYFRGPLTLRHWQGPTGWYDSAILRISPTPDNRHYVPPIGLIAAVTFRKVKLGPREIATFELPPLRPAHGIS